MFETETPPEKLGKHITSTYFSLRWSIFAISVALPVGLYLIGRYNGIALLPSMSDYYPHGTDGSRNWFVGSLFAVGCALWAYRGYSDVENYSLNVAGVLALGIAWFPCRCGNELAAPTPHGFCAVSFFLVMAFVCIKCAPATLTLMTKPEDQRKRAWFQQAYYLTAGFMIVSPGLAYVFSALTGHDGSRTFFTEVFGVYSFATYWLLKNIELKKTDAEELASHGRVKRQAGRVVRVEESLVR
jgi:hypothetical protein